MYNCSVCGSPNVLVYDENGLGLCIPTEIPNCKLHLRDTPTTCHTCKDLFSGSGTEACTCSGTEK